MIVSSLKIIPNVTEAGRVLANDTLESGVVNADFFERRTIRLNASSMAFTAGAGDLAAWGSIVGYVLMLDAGSIDLTYLAAGTEPQKLVSTANGGVAVIAATEVNLNYLKLASTVMTTGELLIWGRLP